MAKTKPAAACVEHAETSGISKLYQQPTHINPNINPAPIETPVGITSLNVVVFASMRYMVIDTHNAAVMKCLKYGTHPLVKINRIPVRIRKGTTTFHGSSKKFKLRR